MKLKTFRITYYLSPSKIIREENVKAKNKGNASYNFYRKHYGSRYIIQLIEIVEVKNK